MPGGGWGKAPGLWPRCVLRGAHRKAGSWLIVVNGVPKSRASGWRWATRVSGSAGAWGAIASRDVIPHVLVPDRRVLHWIRFPLLRESVAGGRKTAEVSAGRVALQKLMSVVWLRNSRRRRSREG
jgi:hypothetical protein